jgi:hypothetical protein
MFCPVINRMELKVGCGSTGIGGVGDKGLRPFPPRAEEERLEGLGSDRLCAKPMDTAQSETEMRAAGRVRKAHVAANM